MTQKMAQQEYIILCLEDSSDWLNATTRRTVMQASAAGIGGTIDNSSCTYAGGLDPFCVALMAFAMSRVWMSCLLEHVLLLHIQCLFASP